MNHHGTTAKYLGVRIIEDRRPEEETIVSCSQAVVAFRERDRSRPSGRGGRQTGSVPPVKSQPAALTYKYVGSFPNPFTSSI